MSCVSEKKKVQFKGKARFMRDGKLSLVMDIEKAAQYRVQDKGAAWPALRKV